MVHKKVFGPLLAIVIAAGVIGCTSGKKQYDLGMQMKAQGNYRKAIVALEEAIAVEPKNEAYQRALADTKNALVGELVAQAEDILQSRIPPSLEILRAAGSKIAEARQVDSQHPSVAEYTQRIKKEETALRATVETLYAQAGNNIAKQQWVEAHAKLQKIEQLLPGYEDTERMVKIVAAKGAPALLQQGKYLFDLQDYKQSAVYFQQVLDINPQLQEARTYLDLVRERDTKQYFFEQGDKALASSDWEQAESAYRRALTYDPADDETKEAIAGMQYKATLHYMREARSCMVSGWLFSAYTSYDLAVKNADTQRHPELESHLRSLRNELGTATAAVAQRLAGEGRHGSAWFWYQKIKNVDPDYPELFFRSQSMEDEIILRLRKSIAVFDFGPPSSAPDTGAIFADNLSTFLFKNASKDIKVLERENLASILEEMKLGRIGAVSSNTAKDIGRVYGFDAAVLGNVLRYSVDSTSYSDTKTVTYQVKKTEENIDYLNWKARNPNPTKEELDQAPVPFIHKMVDVEKEYSVSTHKKVAFVTVSLRIVDIRTGENILVDTIRQTKTATDDTSAGVQVANVQYDPLEIPTDTELLQELTREVVEELGKEALRPLQALEKNYFERAQKYLRRRDSLSAAECFIDAIFTEKVKGIEGSQLGRDANRNVEDIFRHFRVQPEG